METNLNDSQNDLIESNEDIYDTEEAPMTQDKLDQTTLHDKINAIYEMIPTIIECKRICDFLIENRWYQKAYEWYTQKDSEERKMAEIKHVFDYYGIPMSALKNSELLYEYGYVDKKHIDTICKYCAIENIAYDRDRFIYKPRANGQTEERSEYRQVEWGTAPINSYWTNRPPTA